MVIYLLTLVGIMEGTENVDYPTCVRSIHGHVFNLKVDGDLRDGHISSNNALSEQIGEDIEIEVFYDGDIRVNELKLPIISSIQGIMILPYEQLEIPRKHCKRVMEVAKPNKRGKNLDRKIMETNYLSIELQVHVVDILNFISDLQDDLVVVVIVVLVDVVVIPEVI